MYIKVLSLPRPVAVELIPSQRTGLRTTQKELSLSKNNLMSYLKTVSIYGHLLILLLLAFFCRHMLAGTSRDPVYCDVTMVTITR